MSLGIPVTMVCLEEMDEMEQRVTKGMQVLTSWCPLATIPFIHPFLFPHSFIHDLCGHHLLTHSPTAQQTLLKAGSMPDSIAQGKNDRNAILMDFLISWGNLLLATLSATVGPFLGVSDGLDLPALGDRYDASLAHGAFRETQLLSVLAAVQVKSLRLAML